MTEEKPSKEIEHVQEFKLEQDTELRFEMEGKGKVTLEVCLSQQLRNECTILTNILPNSSYQDWLKYLELSW